MQSNSSSDSRTKFNHRQYRHRQSLDENTFTYLPKRPNAICLSTPTMNRLSSKDLRGYQRFGLFLNGLDPVAFNSAVDPRPRSCFNCWSKEHRLSHCPEPLTDIFCCNCGRRYLKIDRCPRCARVFWELDESARQWLISYIPDDEKQENQPDSSEKDWSTYKDDDSCNSPCQENKSEYYNVSGEDHEKEEMAKLRSKDESEDDDWWDCSEGKDDIIEKKSNPIMTEKVEQEEKVFQTVYEEADSTGENQLNSQGESSATTQSDEDDEDYENIIVDEDKQMEESHDMGDIVRDFLGLLKAAKCLPLQKQHAIVLRFASECKKKF